MTDVRGANRRTPGLTTVAVAATALVVLVVLNPWLILSPTTPTGGDMGAHVLGPAFLRDTLLPEGRLIGWSNDWFAGFPAFYFYFPLPSLVIVALDLLLPYGVAFKVVTVLGLVAMAPAIYFMTRAMRLGRSVALVAAGTGAVFAFLESYSIYGGNIASTLAGEFSYSWSFALSLVYFGFLVKAVRDDSKYVKWAAVALAATALSHVLTTLVVIIASLVVLAWRRGPARALLIWAWGFAFAAIWALPLLARIGLTSDMAWNPLTRWEEIFPVELWVLIPAAIPGAVWAVRRSSRVTPMLAATIIPVVYFPLPTLLPSLAPGVFDAERWKLYNGRLLPYWYFGVAFFAAVGLGAAAVWLSRRMPERVSSNWARIVVLVAALVATGLVADAAEFPDWAWVLVLLAGAALLALTGFLPASVGGRRLLVGTSVALVVLGAAAGVTFVDGWARWNYEGYEAKEPWPEYQALMTYLDGLPDGRVMWESNSELNQYGTPMSPMLIPYWTEGSHPSMEGLYFESSLTTPFHFINHSEMSSQPSNPIPGLRYHTFDMERGLRHMDLYGVEYYVSFTPEAADKAAGLEGVSLLSSAGPFSIFSLPETSLVEVATMQPAVYEAPERPLAAALTGSGTVVGEDGEPMPSFGEMALDWYDDIASLDRWVVADGPDQWPRIEDLGQRPSTPLGGGEVSDVEIDHHRISFTTDAIGVPHLVKVSYFPNWRASGAEGPYRAAPSLMVVVPTESEVVLEFGDTWAEIVGKVLTLVAFIALAALWWRARRHADGPPRGGGYAPDREESSERA